MRVQEPLHNVDHSYMIRALALAEGGRGRTSPNPLVGAVVVQDGRIVGEGFHQYLGGPHAEVTALDAAGGAAKGSTLYVTLEPCCHHGRTPPCTDRIIASGVTRVVAAIGDPNPKVAGKGTAALQAAGVEVIVGCLAAEAARQNEAFRKYITTGRPFTIIKYAMTLDGKLATFTGDSKWITAEAARTYVHELRAGMDAILVGIGTVEADDPLLTVRLATRAEGRRPPRRIILDSTARIPLNAKILATAAEAPVMVAVTDRAPLAKRDAIQRTGAEVVQIQADGDGRVDVSALTAWLGEREVSSVLIEGGSTVNTAFLEAGLVDKVLCFVAPKIVGGAQAPTPVEGRGRPRMTEAIELTEVRFTTFGRDLLIEGTVPPLNGGV